MADIKDISKEDLLFLPESSNIFSEKDWVFSWYESISSDNRYSRFIVNCSINKGRELFLPLVVKTRKRPFPFNRFVEYPAQEIACDIDIFDTKDFDRKYIESFFINIINQNEWSVVDLRHLKDSLDVNVINEILKNRCIFKIENDDNVWEIELPDRFEIYLNSLEPKKQKRFKYYLNRIKKITGYKFYFAEDNFDYYWRKFIDLHKERMSMKNEETLLEDNLYKDFYKRLSMKHFKNSTLRLACLEIEKNIVGALLGIEKYKTFYYINSGFSKDHFKYSLGLVLPLLCIEYSIRNSIKRFNLLCGDDEYKKDMKAVCHHTKRIRIFRNNMIRFLESIFSKLVNI